MRRIQIHITNRVQSFGIIRQAQMRLHGAQGVVINPGCRIAEGLELAQLFPGCGKVGGIGRSDNLQRARRVQAQCLLAELNREIAISGQPLGVQAVITLVGGFRSAVDPGEALARGAAGQALPLHHGDLQALAGQKIGGGASDNTTADDYRIKF